MSNNANEVYFKRSEGYAWIQPDGDLSSFLYLNCAALEGFSQSEGDITLLYCKDEGRAGKFRVRDSVQGERGPVTTQLQIPLGKTANYVFGLKCPFNLQARYTTCERPDSPTGWEKILHFKNARVTQRSGDQLAIRTPGNEQEVVTTMALSAEDIYEINRVTVSRESIAAVDELNDVSFGKDNRCAGNCGSAITSCEEGFAVASRTTTAVAKVYHTTNGGGTWAPTATDPFSASEDISSVVFDGTRVIVARGTTDAGNPAEIAYSEDDGATWTLVNVGSVNAQYIKRLFWLSRPYLWATTFTGYVYFSDDAGLTWTAQESGSATVQPLYDINFANTRVGFAVGNANAVIKTIDGGNTWTAVTGPIAATLLNTVSVIDDDTVFIGADNGNVYYSNDGGTTWTTGALATAGVGKVKDVRFSNSSFGFLLKDSASPVDVIYRSIDGGKSWQPLVTPTNVGLNRLSVCDQNTAYAVGKVSTTAVVVEIK